LFPSELLWADSIAWVAYPFPRSLANFVIEWDSFPWTVVPCP
jgi:hypothetical protein